jgi:hypothetical protein
MKGIPIETPADSAGPPHVKTDITPEAIFQAIGRLRKDARDEIIRFPDETDNHMEIEDDGANLEPCLGSFNRMTDQSKAWRTQSLWALPALTLKWMTPIGRTTTQRTEAPTGGDGLMDNDASALRDPGVCDAIMIGRQIRRI